MVCFSPVLLAPLPVEEMEVGRLHEGQEEVFLEGMRQRRGAASFSDNCKTEVIELMVYVDKLLYDRYQQNRAAVERHILAILNLVCAHACMWVCTIHCNVHLCVRCVREGVLCASCVRVCCV